MKTDPGVQSDSNWPEVPLVPPHLRGLKYLRLGLIVERESRKDHTKMRDEETFWTSSNEFTAALEARLFLERLNNDKFIIRPITFSNWYKP
jgi:hypothetical protein